MIDPTTIVLTQEEQEMENELLTGKYIKVKDIETERKIHQQYAKNTLDRMQLTIRPFVKDIHIIRMKAMHEGIPYQSYINSILHKFVTGQLVAN